MPCALTLQYTGLESLYSVRGGAGLGVFGFRANDVMDREPGSEAGIACLCSTEYDVHFPLLSKRSVRGDDRQALYAALTTVRPTAIGDGAFRGRLKGCCIEPGDSVDMLWNFEKLGIHRQSVVVARLSPDVAADDSRRVASIDAELAKT